MPVKGRRESRTNRFRAGRSRVMLVSISGVDKEITGRETGEPCGEIFHPGLPKPVPYRGLAELGFRLYETAGQLKLFAEEREPGFPGTGAPQEEYGRDIPVSQWSREEFHQKCYQKTAGETVWLELLGRQKGSLQGRLRCRKTGGADVYFRSALELMYLFSGLLREAEGKRLAGETLEIDKEG